jgi:hypothetical protein
MVWGLVGLGVAGALVLFAVVLLIVGTDWIGGNEGKRSLPWVALGFAALIALAGGGFWYMGWSGLGRRVLLCPKGFIDYRFGRVAVCPYADVVTFRRALGEPRLLDPRSTTTRGANRFTVQMRDGRQFVYDPEYKEVGELGPRLEEAVKQLLLPRALDEIRQGRPVTCDPFVVTPHGVALGGRDLPWAQLETIVVTRSLIHLHPRFAAAPWCSCPVEGLANAAVFLGLVQTLCAKVHIT